MSIVAGVADLAANRPPADVVLLATKGILVVRNDLSSAIQYLLLNAAAEIHSGAGNIPEGRSVSCRRVGRSAAQ
jgi:hypothetical protein